VTWGGVVATSRATKPSLSKVRSVWASIFSLTPPMRRRSALNRSGSGRRATSTSTAHLLVTWSSTARLGQLLSNTSPRKGMTWVLTSTSGTYQQVRTYRS
jgi:hypothetical protein